MRPRVTVLTNMPSGYQSDLFEAVARRGGCELHVVFLRRLTPGRQWKNLEAGAYPHTFVPEVRLTSAFYLSPGMVAAVARTRPDLLVVTQYAGLGMQAAMYLANALRRPWVFWSERPGVEWSELPPVPGERLRRALRAVALWPLHPPRVAGSGPRAVWGIGSRAAQAYAALTAAPAESLPYHSNLDRFFAIPREVGASRRDAGGTGGSGDDREAGRALRLLYSGKLNVRKGVDLLVEAADGLLAERAGWTLSFMGDGPLRADVEALARRHAGRVELLGFKQLHEVPGVLAAHDVAVAPSRYDGWGLVVPEALAAGMPIVATTGMGAALDIVGSDSDSHSDSGARLGWLAAPDDLASLRAALRAALDAGAPSPQTVALARETARAFTAEAGAEKFLAAVGRALG